MTASKPRRTEPKVRRWASRRSRACRGGRHRELGSGGSTIQTCGATNRNPVAGVSVEGSTLIAEEKSADGIVAQF